MTHLILVEGLRGPEYQIANKEGGRYVGHPPGWKPLAERELPDVAIIGGWTIALARRWCDANPIKEAA